MTPLHYVVYMPSYDIVCYVHLLHYDVDMPSYDIVWNKCTFYTMLFTCIVMTLCVMCTFYTMLFTCLDMTMYVMCTFYTMLCICLVMTLYGITDNNNNNASTCWSIHQPNIPITVSVCQIACSKLVPHFCKHIVATHFVLLVNNCVLH